MVNLRVIPPTAYIGAVEAIPLVSAAIEQLSAKDSIYPVDQDLYFKVHEDAHFGTRSHLSQDEMLTIFSERGGDPGRSGKKDPLDCLVWMSQRPNEPGWESSIGLGRPGWHIECTAIALKYLDPSDLDSTLIDIQGGGSDLIFPHHEMCAAQAHVLTGKELAASYVHTGMIGLDGEKMSKSLGNLVFVSKLRQHGVDPMAIRLVLLSHHYRSDWEWFDSELEDAQTRLANWRTALSYPTGATSPVAEIVMVMRNDLDTPSALKAIDVWAAETLAGAQLDATSEVAVAIDAILGII